MSSILIFSIGVYQKFLRSALEAILKPAFRADCLFVPSCSQYAKEAIEGHGAWKGLGLVFKRISKCRAGRVLQADPVPHVRKS